MTSHSKGHTRKVVVSSQEFLHRVYESWLVSGLTCAMAGETPPKEMRDWHRLKPLSRSFLSGLKRDLDGLSAFTINTYFAGMEERPVDEVVGAFVEMAKAFITANSAGQIYSPGRVYELEKRYGRLKITDHGGPETPPYAIFLLQGFNGFTIQHPEYHLSVDICSLHRLVIEERHKLTEAKTRNLPTSSEHFQTLTRATVVAVYNLLESVANGLAVAWRLEHPGVPNAVLDSLEGPSVPLWRRFLSMPAAVTERPIRFDSHAEPFTSLFWRLKSRRDYIVHCQPDKEPGKYDQAPPEEDFHDIPLSAVDETIEKAIEAIRLVWSAVHGRPRPSWLPDRSDCGTYWQIKSRDAFRQDRQRKFDEINSA